MGLFSGLESMISSPMQAVEGIASSLNPMNLLSEATSMFGGGMGGGDSSSGLLPGLSIGGMGGTGGIESAASGLTGGSSGGGNPMSMLDGSGSSGGTDGSGGSDGMSGILNFAEDVLPIAAMFL